MLYLYLDESGDLGFDFVNKKPSKFFVVTILAVKGNEANRCLINGVKKTLRRKLNPKKKRKRIVEEIKGTKTIIDIKEYFYRQISDLEFGIYSIILNKKRVYQYLIKDKSRVYNYIARQVLDRIPYENAQEKIILIIDKSKSKPEIIEFNSYIRRQLESKIDPTVPFYINHADSKENFALQATDLFSYAIFEKYERAREEWFRIIEKKIKYYSVYLPNK
ncbi:MAG TPA: DUF3800 domain-containing protein [Smithellaceae bacterium]|nr:DUF3800 domain-containing protein [Smithellaceae bacterium]HRS88481.1 DUF3800 domain-containing protein [Smithellaceae bacterium]HRV25537.1 DUF3800 domain-containing protein [Smithellaceae bacterium]